MKTASTTRTHVKFQGANLSSQSLTDLLRQHGYKVTEVDTCKSFANNTGYGFVSFDTGEEAARAMTQPININNVVIRVHPIKCNMPSKSKSKSLTSTSPTRSISSTATTGTTITSSSTASHPSSTVTTHLVDSDKYRAAVQYQWYRNVRNKWVRYPADVEHQLEHVLLSDPIPTTVKYIIEDKEKLLNTEEMIEYDSLNTCEKNPIARIAIHNDPIWFIKFSHHWEALDAPQCREIEFRYRMGARDATVVFHDFEGEETSYFIDFSTMNCNPVSDSLDKSPIWRQPYSVIVTHERNWSKASTYDASLALLLAGHPVAADISTEELQRLAAESTWFRLVDEESQPVLLLRPGDGNHTKFLPRNRIKPPKITLDTWQPHHDCKYGLDCRKRFEYAHLMVFRHPCKFGRSCLLLRDDKAESDQGKIHRAFYSHEGDLRMPKEAPVTPL